jgi:bifunctional non-homologous end joining protein LigD
MATRQRQQPEELDGYRSKRRFDATPEPSGETTPQQGGERFVVHEHHARRLHWDLRLERDGVLASWAIPNGIPDDPKRNRKAIHVEDHPLDYIDFHGTIPSGNYGAGEVTIWDHGTYRCEKWRKDEVIVVFEGERLTGRYVLFRAGHDEKDWMIHRMRRRCPTSSRRCSPSSRRCRQMSPNGPSRSSGTACARSPTQSRDVCGS